MNTNFQVTFWIMVGLFVFVMSEIFVPVIQDIFQGPIFLLPIGLFAVASGVLTWQIVCSRVDNGIKKFMLLAGICGVGFFVGVILHNLFYAAGMLAKDSVVLKYLFEAVHVFFFILSTIVCPIGFLIGAGGSIWQMTKIKYKKVA